MNIREKILVVEDEKSISHFISTILNSNGYEAIMKMPVKGGERWTKLTATFTDQIQDGIPISYTVMTDIEDIMQAKQEQTIAYENLPGFISKNKIGRDGSFTLLDANDKYMEFAGVSKGEYPFFSPFSRGGGISALRGLVQSKPPSPV